MKTVKTWKSFEFCTPSTTLCFYYLMPFRMPFAGEGEFFTPDSLLSHCYGALLPMFTTAEATVLGQLCREFRSTVADFPWEDDETVIMGSVAAWRACFPRARWANVNGFFGEGGRMTPLVDADFVHFEGLRRLNMRGCKRITGAAFVHLKGVHNLNMGWCRRITGTSFVHLQGIHTLNMDYCDQATITDVAFVHLKGIHTLDMAWCKQATITDAAFVHLKGIHSLNMAGCNQASITDAALAHLEGHLGGIHSLSLYFCTQLTSAVFTHLKGIKRLNIGFCSQLNFTDDSLEGIEWLNMGCLSQAQIEKAESFGYPVDTSQTTST